MRRLRFSLPFVLLASPFLVGVSDTASFEPEHRLAGIGAGRRDISDELLDRRTELMIDTQSFAILRDPRALAGAERVLGRNLQKLFVDAERRTGIPASLLSAIAYLESWGDAKAQSPAGPRGIMQIATGTARVMGLKISYARRYRTARERVRVRTRGGKLAWKTVKRRIPYTVLVRDERLIPEKAIPAAARYLARLENELGGRDWAVFAYHCGEGCVAEVRELAARAEGIPSRFSVARVFFSASPAHNRELYKILQAHMERDWSPTYWFRVRRAEQLLALYREDRQAFRKLFESYRYAGDREARAPHRLAVWIKAGDLLYQNCDDLRRAQGARLVRAFDDPRSFGFRLPEGLLGRGDDRDLYLQASPSAIGALAYIAFETRRLHQAMSLRQERFVPLEVSALVRPLDEAAAPPLSNGRRSEAGSHCSGQVFDINLTSLPPGEREALQFVLNDMGWDGYLGFIEEVPGAHTLHIGASPSSRDFFAQVYEDGLSLLARR
ncbi:MAG: transglycosylase SLT domain-containing protein [Acidobacteria bacterium]|nr:transglycosylase SLT domain-containing protein [Acidobacteriota bacterium]